MKIYAINNLYNNSLSYARQKNSSFTGNAVVINNSNDEQPKKNNKYLYTSLIGLGSAIALGIAARKCYLSKQMKNIKKPKFLYHLTSFENYQSILRDGVIKKSNPRLGNGVFLSNIEDLKYKYPDKALERMIDWYGNTESKKVVLLKIPVENMQGGTINWRPVKIEENAGRVKSDTWQSFDDFTARKLKSLHNEPIEFLYNNEIPVNKIKSAKVIDLNEIDKGDNFIKDFWVKAKEPRNWAEDNYAGKYEVQVPPNLVKS